MIKLLSILLVGFIILPLSAEKYRIAILDFKKGNEISTEEAELISGLVRTKMVKQKNFTVIDRENVSKVFKEQALVQKGCTDSSCEVQIGKLLAANKIMTGSVAKLGNSYVINALVTDVEKGTTEVGENETVSSMDEMNKAVGRLTEKITEAMIADLPESKRVRPIKPVLQSSVIPGWGQFSNGQKLKSGLFAISFLASVGALANSINQYKAEKDTYDNHVTLGYLSFVSSTQGIGLYSSIKSSESRSNLSSNAIQIQGFSLLTLAVYLYNLADAYYYAKESQPNPISKKVGFQFQIQNQISQTTQTQSLETNYTLIYQWRF